MARDLRWVLLGHDREPSTAAARGPAGAARRRAHPAACVAASADLEIAAKSFPKYVGCRGVCRQPPAHRAPSGVPGRGAPAVIPLGLTPSLARPPGGHRRDRTASGGTTTSPRQARSTGPRTPAPTGSGAPSGSAGQSGDGSSATSGTPSPANIPSPAGSSTAGASLARARWGPPIRTSPPPARPARNGGSSKR